MLEPGRFIVVEGLEGAGKTSAIQTIKHFIEAIPRQVTVTREPGGTRIGEELRSLVKKTMENEVLEARSELLLMYAARVQLVEQVIKPALKRGDWVIADRFELSTYAYQGGGRGISTHILDSLSTICLGNFKPDLVVFLDISPAEGLARVKKRGKFDRIEQEPLTFFNKVHEGYHQRIQKMDNVCIIDASAPIEFVQDSIIKQLTLFLHRHDYA
ncbi:MAG: dTMP kinase [Legionella sp.]|nr:dTMP kinase [Legionella sp.]